MPENSSLPFVDPKTGAIKTFEIRLETVVHKVLPDLGYYAVQGAKVALAALFFSPPMAVGLVLAATAAQAAARIVGWGRAAVTYQKHFAAPEYSAFSVIDLATPGGRKRFAFRYGEKFPHFVDDLTRLSADAGLGSVPRLMIMNEETAAEAGFKGAAAARYYEIGSMTSPSFAKKKDGIILVGAGALDTLKPAELLARTAQEIARLRMNEGGQRRVTRGHLIFGGILSAAMALAAFRTKEMPLKVVTGFLPVADVAGFAILSARRRRAQAKAERGGVLLTGDTANAITALAALRKKGGTARTIDYPLTLTLTGIVDPPDLVGYRALEAFEKAHPAFCAARRVRCATTFNAAVSPANGNTLANTKASLPTPPR